MTDSRAFYTTEEEFTAALEEAVRRRGEDYQYPGAKEAAQQMKSFQCQYSRDGEPMCIVGMAYYIATGELVPSGQEGMSARHVLVRHFPLLSGKFNYAVQRAQQEQDKGATWGTALETFKEEVAWASQTAVSS